MYCIIGFELVCIFINCLCKYWYRYKCQGLGFGLENLTPRSRTRDLSAKALVLVFETMTQRSHVF